MNKPSTEELSRRIADLYNRVDRIEIDMDSLTTEVLLREGKDIALELRAILTELVGDTYSGGDNGRA